MKDQTETERRYRWSVNRKLHLTEPIVGDYIMNVIEELLEAEGQDAAMCKRFKQTIYHKHFPTSNRPTEHETIVDAVLDNIQYSYDFLFKYCQKHNLDYNICINENLKEIEDRTGSYSEELGKFVKDIKEDRYIANYDLAKKD